MLSSKFCDTIVNSLKAHFNIDCLDIKLEYYNNYRTHFSLVCEDTVNTGYFGMDVEFNRLILEPNEIKNFSVYAQTDDYQTFGSYFKKCIFLEPFLSSIESINNSIIMPKHNDISMSLMNKANPYKYNLFNGTTYIVDEIVQFNSINSVYNDYHIRYIDTINGSSTIAQISIMINIILLSLFIRLRKMQINNLKNLNLKELK